MESFHLAHGYRNSSIFLMMTRSLPGGGDRGSAMSDASENPSRPSAGWSAGAGPGDRNVLVLGENSPGTSSNGRMKRSVLAVEYGPSGRRRLDSDFIYLHLGSMAWKLCPRCRGRGDKLRLCASDFGAAPSAGGAPGLVDGTESELADA